MDSNVPIYQQIVQYIMDCITNNTYQKGAVIPSEQELCRKFDTSRMTVRKAIDELVKEGWLYRVKGRGAFVSHFELQKTYTLHGFTQNMTQLGFKPSSKVLDFKIIKPDHEIAEILNLLPTDNVYYLKRLRLVDQEPVAVEKAFLAEKRFPGLIDYSFEENSLYDVLKNTYETEAAFAQQKLNAIMVEGEVAKILFHKSKGVALHMRSVDFTKNMSPFIHADSLYHGTKYTFNVLLK